jgi:hypothetical protein
MRILNWNTEFASPRGRAVRFPKVKALIASYNPYVICLTEAYPETMPELGHTITSELSGAGNIENRGARKVVLWSRFGWSNVNTFGRPNMPPGRFIKATASPDYEQWTIIGMRIPYAHYRNHAKWGVSAKDILGWRLRISRCPKRRGPASPNPRRILATQQKIPCAPSF